MATHASDIRTDRLVVLLTPGEKDDLTQRARAANVSLSEFVRSAASRYDEAAPALSDAQAQAIEQELAGIKARLDAVFARVDRYLEELGAVDEDAVRARTRAELERADVDWLAVRGALRISA